MGKLPPVSGKELCRALERDGYKPVRQVGSHRIYQKQSDDEVITVPVPVHANRPLKRGTLFGILRKAGITRERLSFLLTVLFG